MRDKSFELTEDGCGLDIRKKILYCEALKQVSQGSCG